MDCLFAVLSHFSIDRQCQRVGLVLEDGDGRNTRRGRGVRVLQSRIAVPVMSEIKQWFMKRKV